MTEAALRPSLPRGVPATLIVFGVLGATLLTIGPKNYPGLHTILDTGMARVWGALALFLGDRGVQPGHPPPNRLAVCFAVTSLLEFLHVLVPVEWSGPLAPIAAAEASLRPAPWPPAAPLLPAS